MSSTMTRRGRLSVEIALILLSTNYSSEPIALSSFIYIRSSGLGVGLEFRLQKSSIANSFNSRLILSLLFTFLARLNNYWLFDN